MLYGCSMRRNLKHWQIIRNVIGHQPNIGSLVFVITVLLVKSNYVQNWQRMKFFALTTSIIKLLSCIINWNFICVIVLFSGVICSSNQ